ncbi:MAG: hypothetical protein J6W35_00800 [Eubacterium sp.]|nr:hypothetical protein [Eubacterium sp.]
MKRLRIITSIVLSIALLAGLVLSFTAPSTEVFAKSEEQTTNYIDEIDLLDRVFGKEDSHKGSSDPKAVYDHISKFVKNNYSSLTKKKLQNEFDYLKDSAEAIVRAKLNDQSSLGKIMKKVEFYINSVRAFWNTYVYNNNLKKLINNFELAADEAKLAFSSIRDDFKGKKPLDIIEYLLDEKTHDKYVHYALNIDGILFKGVNVKTLIPKQFTNKTIDKFTDKVKSVADTGTSYNKMSTAKKKQVRRKMVVKINEPVYRIRDQINTALIQVEHRVLKIYKDIAGNIKKKLAGFKSLEKEAEANLQEDW